MIRPPLTAAEQYRSLAAKSQRPDAEMQRIADDWNSVFGVSAPVTAEQIRREIIQAANTMRRAS